MSSGNDWDVVVVGGGLGGLSAACRAAQLGMKVAVLERGSEPQYLCNSRFSGGILHISQHNVQEPVEDLVQVIHEATLGECDPALARALAVDAHPGERQGRPRRQHQRRRQLEPQLPQLRLDLAHASADASTPEKGDSFEFSRI